MKRKGYIVLTSLLVVFGIALCVLNSSAFQRRLIHDITQSFFETSGTGIKVERASINLFRGIALHKVVLSDSTGIPFLRAERLEVGIRIIPLLKRRVELHAVRIIQANIRLFRKTPDSPLNIQAFLSSFQSPQKMKSNWQLRFRHIMVRESNFSYDVLSLPEKNDQIDANHISINNLSTLVRLSLSPRATSYTLTIAKLNATSCCGIAVKKLTGKLTLNEDHATLQSFRIETSGSSLTCPELTLSYPRLKHAFDDLDSLSCAPTVLKGHILPTEWAFLRPELANVSRPVTFSVSMQGSTREWIIQRIRLSLEKMIQIEGSVTMTHLLEPKRFTMNSRIGLLKLAPEGIGFLTELLSKKTVDMPVLQKLGAISYMGNVSLSGNRMDVKGYFTSAAGPLNSNLSITLGPDKSVLYNGRLNTSGFNLARLSTSSSTLGRVAMDVAVEGVQQRDSALSGKLTGSVGMLEIGGYAYRNISLDGLLSKNKFQGKASLNDENAKLDFSGLMDASGEKSHYLFDLTVSHVNLHALHVLKKGTTSDLSFKLQADLTGKTLEDIQGDLLVDGLTFSQNGKQLSVDQIKAKAIQGKTRSTLNVTSNLLDATIEGRFRLNQLSPLFSQLANQYVPSAFTLPQFKNPSLKSDIDIHATLYPSENLTAVLQLPVSYQQNVTLDAYYRSATNKFRIKAVVPKLAYGKASFQSFSLLVENPMNEVKCIAHAQVGKEENPMDVDVDIRTSNDQSTFKFFWSNSGTETHTGTIQGGVLFSRNAMGHPVIDVAIKPSAIILSDSTWQIHPASVNIDNGRIRVESFQLSHRDEFIRINGIASAQVNDTLSVLFNSFRLDEIIRLIPKSQLFFGGQITGKANCPHLLENGTMDAELFVEKFSLNGVQLGNLTASTRWNMERRALELAGTVRSLATENQPTRVLATASGDYLPFSDSLKLDIKAQRVNLRFLEPYLNTVVQNLDAVGSGNVRVVGPMKKVGIYANAFAERASFSIGMLNTTYWFSDSIFVTPTQISFNKIKVLDKEGNSGYASGMIRHDHFKNMRVQVDANLDKMLVMDLPETPNALFYGTAYGSGTVSISGPENNILLDVNMRTDDRTKVTISPMEATDELDENFMQFVDFRNRRYRQPTISTIIRKDKQPTSLIKEPSNMTINLQIEATPNAELTLITDPNTGDEIKSRGSGAIRAVFDDNSDLNLFGRYTIENGSYKFIYENIIRRDFSIVRGSTINFSGDPFAARLDITANHTVDAQLFDLIPSSELSSLNLIKNSIPVNCVLKLGGELQRPDIKLDMDFPSADDELVRRIRNVINTEELMNQQIVYLLLFGRFSSPSTNTNTGQSNVSSVLNTAISTLSSQVNSILNNAFGYSNLSFDVDYQNTGYESGLPGEFKVGVSGQWLDDRLTIQGNLGSRENLAQAGTSQFIGEFDLKLRMKNSEKWSWKLFNRANDNRYFKSALNTQGFGLVYDEEFNNPMELLQQLIESIKKPFRKKTTK